MRCAHGISLGSLVVALALAGSAHAQAVTEQAPDASTPSASSPAQSDAASTIVVTGYRQSLKVAQDYKRRAVGSEDDIIAQDIAAFPDLNLAESIQRVPGVTINRDTGEGRQITLRGLGPDFTRTELNGMEVLTNTASGMDNRGSVSRTRSFDYSLFASELFDRVSVEKSYAADRDEGGIGGTIALYSAKPFDYAGAKFVISAKGQTNTNTSGVTPRIVALASNRWGDFGALVSVAYSRIKSNEYGYRDWGWGQLWYNPANIGPNIDPATRAALIGQGTTDAQRNNDPNRILAPQANTLSSWWTNRQRLGITSSLQYHPGNNFKIDADFLFGRLWDRRNNWALATAGPNGLAGNVNGDQVIQSATIQNGALVAGSWTGIDLRSEHNIQQSSTNFYQGVITSTWKPTDRLTVTALGGFEKSIFRQPLFDKVLLLSSNHGFTNNAMGALPVNTYDFNLTDPSSWGLNELDSEQDGITSQYANAKLDTSYKLSSSSTFEFGGAFKHFINSGYKYQDVVSYDQPLADSLKTVTDVDSIMPYVGGDIAGVFNSVGQSQAASTLAPGSNFKESEKTWSAYAQYDLDTEIMGLHTRANVGVHYYNTALTSSGSLVNGGTLAPISVTTHVHGWLPAANIAIELQRNLLLRASASRNINRPGISDISASGSYFVSLQAGGISVGNPNVKPYKSTNVEGSLEYYFGKVGFASLGLFYKKMDSFITTQTEVIPFSQTGYPSSILLPGTVGDIPFTVSQPINGPGADIKGLEAAFQHDFDFLPAPFNHLGINANGTWFDGHQKGIYKINQLDGSVVTLVKTLPLSNLSKWAANATLYYDTDRWGVRGSIAFRSLYLTDTGGVGTYGNGYLPTTNVDAQAHFNITPHLKLIAEGINLTNERIAQFTDLDAKHPAVYTKSGRTFTFGVTAEF